MNSTLQTILAVILLSTIGAIVDLYYGINGKAVLAALIAVLAIAVTVIYSRQKIRLKRELQAMTPEILAIYRDECIDSGAGDPIEIINRPELTLIGELVNFLFGVTALFLPPSIYHILMGLPVSRDSEVTGWHIFWMVIGTGIYLFFRKKILKPFMTSIEHAPPGGRDEAPRP